MDWVNEPRTVVAGERANECVEVRGPVAGDIDRQADPRRTSGRYAGIPEGKLRYVAEQLAAEARGLKEDARVIAGSDRHGVVEDRAVRGAGADAPVDSATRVPVRGVRRAVEAQELIGAVTCRSRSSVAKQDRGGENGDDAKRTRDCSDYLHLVHSTPESRPRRLTR